MSERVHQDAADMPEDIVRAWVEAQIGTPEAARQSQRLERPSLAHALAWLT